MAFIEQQSPAALAETPFHSCGSMRYGKSLSFHLGCELAVYKSTHLVFGTTFLQSKY